jgi:tetratricopeptide (TPR) repeat protein
MIARHLLLAGRKKQACQYFLHAGQAALASYANHEAEGYFRQALELSPEIDQKAACLAGLGEALRRQGQREESIQILRQWIYLYLKLEDHDAAAHLYTCLSRVLWEDDYEKSWDTCQEGLAKLEGSQESPGLARLLAEAGRAAHFQVKPTKEVVSLSQEGIDIAERCGELEAKAEASITIALRSDFDKCISLLQEVAAFCIANNLLRSAARAFIGLGHVSTQNFRSLEVASQNHMHAVDISILVGDNGVLLITLGNLAENLIEQGHLRNVEDKLTEILHNSTVPRSQVEEFLEWLRSYLQLSKGDWIQALKFIKSRQIKLREGRSIQFIANNNIALTTAYLELNRFTDVTDLSEAEVAIKENIKFGWHALQSRFLMVILLSRQERIIEAHEWLTDVVNDLGQPINRCNVVFRFKAEAELARVKRCWEEALSKNQALIDIYQLGGYRWQWARQLIDLGDALIGRNIPGDFEKANETYKQSLEMFTEMEASGYIQVLEERLGEV